MRERRSTEGGRLTSRQRENCDHAETAQTCDGNTRHSGRTDASFGGNGPGNRAGNGPYAGLARVLAAFLPTERGRLGVKAPQSPVRAADERADSGTECAGCALAP